MYDLPKPRDLRNCECGSLVLMKYDPGCTYIKCPRENETKEAVPDWNPDELKKIWNTKNK